MEQYGYIQYLFEASYYGASAKNISEKMTVKEGRKGCYTHTYMDIHQ